MFTQTQRGWFATLHFQIAWKIILNINMSDRSFRHNELQNRTLHAELARWSDTKTALVQQIEQPLTGRVAQNPLHYLQLSYYLRTLIFSGSCWLRWLIITSLNKILHMSCKVNIKFFHCRPLRTSTDVKLCGHLNIDVERKIKFSKSHCCS